MNAREIAEKLLQELKGTDEIGLHTFIPPDDFGTVSSYVKPRQLETLCTAYRALEAKHKETMDHMHRKNTLISDLKDKHKIAVEALKHCDVKHEYCGVVEDALSVIQKEDGDE